MRTTLLAAALLLVIVGCSSPGPIKGGPNIVPSAGPVELVDETAAPEATSDPNTQPPAKATPKPKVTPKPKATPKPTKKPSTVYYANCAAVRAAGKDPLHRGDPGYREGLDRDNDGLACE